MAEYLPILYDAKIKERFLEVVDEKIYNREIIFAKQAFDGNDILQKCNPESIRNSIVNIALTGATLNPALQQAFLIPRKGKCCLDFSYRGLCRIAVDSESVYDIDATAVFDGDEFTFEMGLNPVLIHKPKMFDDDKEKKVIAVYAIATLYHNIKKFIVLDHEKIERARKASQMPNGAMWKDHYDEAARKTAVKLLYKLLPQSERMSHAVAALNEQEGLTPSQSKAEIVMARFVDTDLSICPNSGNPIVLAECENCSDMQPTPGDYCPVYRGNST